MTEPRNREAYERGQEIRAQICALLLTHPPGAKPLTAKQIRRSLSCELSERQIQKHVAAIRQQNERDRGREANPNNEALGALHSPAAVAHAGTHGSTSPNTRPGNAAASRPLHQGVRGNDGPVAFEPLPADRFGKTQDRARWPAPTSAGERSAAHRLRGTLMGESRILERVIPGLARKPVDKLADFKDRPQDSRQQWEPDAI